MSTADSAKKATALEATLKGKAFLGGNTPSAEDVKAFQELLGSGNTALYRWVRNIASYTGEQRKAFGAAPKGKTTTYSLLTAAPKEAKPAAAPAKVEAPKAAPAPAPAVDSDEEDLFAEVTPEQQAALDKRKADIAMAMAKKASAGNRGMLGHGWKYPRVQYPARGALYFPYQPGSIPGSSKQYSRCTAWYE